MPKPALLGYVLLAAVLFCTRTPVAAETRTPTAEEIRETLRRFNQSGGMPVPQAQPRPPKGAEQFNRAVQLHSKKNASAAELKEAAGLYQIAADAGIPQASTNLALLYLDGKGVKKDVKKALVLLKAASDKNETSADLTLARLYLNGTDVKRDEKKGEALLNKAAKTGNPNAVKMQAEYKEWKKKNQQAMKEYQELMKKVQLTPVTPGSPPQPLQFLPPGTLAPAALPFPVIPGYAYLSGRKTVMPNFLTPSAPHIQQQQVQPIQPLNLIPVPGGVPQAVTAAPAPTPADPAPSPAAAGK